MAARAAANDSNLKTTLCNGWLTLSKTSNISRSMQRCWSRSSAYLTPSSGTLELGHGGRPSYTLTRWTCTTYSPCLAANADSKVAPTPNNDSLPSAQHLLKFAGVGQPPPRVWAHSCHVKIPPPPFERVTHSSMHHQAVENVLQGSIHELRSFWRFVSSWHAPQHRRHRPKLLRHEVW